MNYKLDLDDGLRNLILSWFKTNPKVSCIRILPSPRNESGQVLLKFINGSDSTCNLLLRQEGFSIEEVKS